MRPGRLRRGRRLLGWSVLTSMLGAGLWVAYREVSPLIQDQLQVREVLVQGVAHLTRQEIVTRLALPPGATLLSLDTGRLAARLRTHPWIKMAEVERRLPNRLEIRVEERRPAAVLSTQTVSFLLDDEGQILGVSDAEAYDRLPLLRGLDANRVMQGEASSRAATQAGVRLALVLETALPSTGGRDRVLVDLSEPDDVRAFVKGMEVRFGASAFEEKWGRYQLIEPDLASIGRPEERQSGNDRRVKAHEIDLRYDGKVIVRERG